MRLATHAVADVVGSSSPLDAWRSGLAARMSLPVAAGQFGGKFPQATGRRRVASLLAWLGHLRFAPLVEAWREVGSAGQGRRDRLDGGPRGVGRALPEVLQQVLTQPMQPTGAVSGDAAVRHPRIGRVGPDAASGQLVDEACLTAASNLKSVGSHS